MDLYRMIIKFKWKTKGQETPKCPLKEEGYGIRTAYHISRVIIKILKLNRMISAKREKQFNGESPKADWRV